MNKHAFILLAALATTQSTASPYIRECGMVKGLRSDFLSPPRDLSPVVVKEDNNGAEFTGHLVDLWAYHHNERIDFSRPGKPTDNAFIETFNGSLRDECLNLHWFDNLAEAKRLIEAWRIDYNVSPPHMGIGNIPPKEYALQVELLEQNIGSDAVRN